MLQDASSTNGSAARKPPSPYRLTPEQILLSEQRKAKTAEKARLAAEKASVESESNPDGLSLGRDAALATLGERGRIIGRRWIGVTPDSSHEEFGYKVKVMSWNVRLLVLLLSFQCANESAILVAPCASSRPTRTLPYERQCAENRREGADDTSRDSGEERGYYVSASELARLPVPNSLCDPEFAPTHTDS